VNKKEAKKTFVILDHARFTATGLKPIKVFCFFFSKKKSFLTYFLRARSLKEPSPCNPSPPVPRNMTTGPSGSIGWIIVAGAGFHAGAALVHHYVFKDRLLSRMVP
jgi:hypothetical protein